MPQKKKTTKAPVGTMTLSQVVSEVKKQVTSVVGLGYRPTRVTFRPGPSCIEIKLRKSS